MAQKRPPSPAVLGEDAPLPKRRRPQRTGVALGRPQTVNRITSISGVVTSILKLRGNFRYTDLTKNQLRLLELHPARDRGDSIVCELRTVEFADLPNLPYDALSYTWGNSEATKEISIRVPEVAHRARRMSLSSGPINSKWQGVVPRVLQMQKDAGSRERKLWQKNFYITSNLETALRHFRDDEATVTLWVDAICIDQENEEEKGQQVARMAEVYYRAKAVRVWLGEAGPETKGVTDFAKSILDLSKLEDSISNPSADPRPWHQLSQLMRRDWFARRWVVQELALAREAFLHVGDEDLHWDDFAEAVALFAQEAKRIEALFERFPRYQYVGDVRSSGAFRIIEITNNLFRWSGGNSDGPLDKARAERLISLEELVSQLDMFNALDPRDTIFALLALARDIPNTFYDAQNRSTDGSDAKPQPLLVADYTTNELEVFKNFIAFCCEMSGSLDIICRHWAPNVPPLRLTVEDRLRMQANPDYRPKPAEIDLPSWIPLLRDAAFTPAYDSLSGSRRAADDLVGLPNNRRYHAAGNFKAAIWFGEVDMEDKESAVQETGSTERDAVARLKDGKMGSSIPPWSPSNHKVTAKETLQRGRKRRSDGCMYVLGFRAGRICDLSGRLRDGEISKEALDMSGWILDTEEANNPKDTVWRSFIADRDKHGNNPPLWYRRALLTCIAQRNHTDDIHPKEVRKLTKSVPMHNFLDRLEAVLWNKQVMRLKSEDGNGEQFGIAPHKAERGDIVCVLLGCSVPVVLREVESAEGTYYEFIGEVYVYNLMAGEALRKFDGLSEEKVHKEATEFRLR